MTRPLSPPLLLLLLLAAGVASASSCVSFSSTICNDVIASYPTQQVYTTNPALLPVYESELESSAANFTTVAIILVPDCYELARRFICANVFPPCGSGGSTCLPLFGFGLVMIGPGVSGFKEREEEEERERAEKKRMSFRQAAIHRSRVDSCRSHRSRTSCQKKQQEGS